MIKKNAVITNSQDRSNEHNKPTICLLGPLTGRNPGYVPTPAELLASLFAREGFPVIASSGSPNRYRRLVEIAWTLIRHGNRVDVVCLQVYSGRSFVVEDIASWLARRQGCKIVMHLHGGAMPTFMAKFPRWTQRVFARSDAFVVPSRYLARAMAESGFACEVIPNVVEFDSEFYRPRTEVRPRLFWMRAFQEIYNPLMAVRVLSRLRESEPEATLVMAGQDMGMLSQTRELAQELGVSQAVSFPGFLGPVEKRRESERADIFLNTNRIDNTPVSVIEACAMGLPVVATDVGGLRDLLEDGHDGLLVPENDDVSMVQAIQRLLSEPELVRRLTANGKAVVEQCSWEFVRPQWFRLFHSLSPRDRRRSSA